MPIYWNFRKILSVEPTTDTCAAEAKSRHRPCTKPLNPQKRLQARQLLDKMDRQKDVSSKRFTDLAEEMLCREVHNSPIRPSHNQVLEVSAKWQAIFYDHTVRGKQKVEMLKRTQSIVRQTSEIKSLQEDSQPAKTVFNEIESETKVCFLLYATRASG